MKNSSALLFVCILLLLTACSKGNEEEQKENQNNTEQDELEEQDTKENLDPATGLFMEFIKENKDTDRIAFLAAWNDEPIAEINPDLALPLASVVKIIIAIEFASQAEEGKMDPSEMISMEEVDKYFFANTDGGAHEAWKNTLEDGEEQVSLEQIAQGMMDYSSNANTDYLIERLGLEEVNNRIEELDLHNHDPIYPLTASIAIPERVLEENNLEEDELEAALRDLDDDAYRQIAIGLFEEWQQEPLSEEEKEKAVALVDMPIQKVWSDRLTHATAEDYYKIMAMLNKKEHYSDAFYEELDAIFSLELENEAIERAAQKGGSTAFVLNQAVYAEDKAGNRLEVILFTNDLNLSELEVAAMQMQALTDKLVNEEDFREEVRDALAE
ncbi:serine hydrolase [Oceanobacillus neutriphilus]|uniref:D-alanyl-D-alanine carboxypeptidase n=1 Tax=Oceanobacillus neutriphilus TaxID=531815 RepID=A0ABQ2P1Q5_9BACI|nr:serine hydrolase [Oceanobacillus neutriphilus]GGP15969.1 D-alanyl-D-alanine carboxypeptidase [Oceanobacillus neutriphilus]